MKTKFPRADFVRDRARRNHMHSRIPSRLRAPQVKKKKTQRPGITAQGQATQLSPTTAAAGEDQQPTSQPIQIASIPTLAQLAEAIVKVRREQLILRHCLDGLARTSVHHGRDLSYRSKAFDNLCTLIDGLGSRFDELSELVTPAEKFIVRRYGNEYEEFADDLMLEGLSSNSRYPGIYDQSNPEMVSFQEKRSFIDNWLLSIGEGRSSPMLPATEPPQARTSPVPAPNAISLSLDESSGITPLSQLNSSMVSDGPVWGWPPATKPKTASDDPFDVEANYQSEKRKRLEAATEEQIFKEVFGFSPYPQPQELATEDPRLRRKPNVTAPHAQAQQHAVPDPHIQQQLQAFAASVPPAPPMFKHSQSHPDPHVASQQQQEQLLLQQRVSVSHQTQSPAQGQNKQSLDARTTFTRDRTEQPFMAAISRTHPQSAPQLLPSQMARPPIPAQALANKYTQPTPPSIQSLIQRSSSMQWTPQQQLQLLQYQQAQRHRAAQMQQEQMLQRQLQAQHQACQQQTAHLVNSQLQQSKKVQQHQADPKHQPYATLSSLPFTQAITASPYSAQVQVSYQTYAGPQPQQHGDSWFQQKQCQHQQRGGVGNGGNQ
ncbi:hypothetical protein MPH_00288 [Macrophomina phaseolina MS6]|uniref:Uncharacterized protein n=1 Tax=Macrophomina phaseolina (strain MS6) TaxID=1126212 RepID=K2S5Z1_MACPH|nr:hypothetical protein MPH_00288 [Macrophomina phaseolina MS6]